MSLSQQIYRVLGRCIRDIYYADQGGKLVHDPSPIDEVESLLRTLAESQFIRATIFDELRWSASYDSDMLPEGAQARFEEKVTTALAAIVVRDEPKSSVEQVDVDLLLRTLCSIYDMIGSP